MKLLGSIITDECRPQQPACRLLYDPLCPAVFVTLGVQLRTESRQRGCHLPELQPLGLSTGSRHPTRSHGRVGEDNLRLCFEVCRSAVGGIRSGVCISAVLELRDDCVGCDAAMIFARVRQRSPPVHVTERIEPAARDGSHTESLVHLERSPVSLETKLLQPNTGSTSLPPRSHKDLGGSDGFSIGKFYRRRSVFASLG